jgi:hypothetical protein
MAKSPTAVLTIRVGRETHRRLALEAARQRRTRSEVARTILEASLSGRRVRDPRIEARRQSKLAAAQAAESDVLRFITEAADLRGWK